MSGNRIEALPCTTCSCQRGVVRSALFQLWICQMFIMTNASDRWSVAKLVDLSTPSPPSTEVPSMPIPSEAVWLSDESIYLHSVSWSMRDKGWQSIYRLCNYPLHQWWNVSSSAMGMKLSSRWCIQVRSHLRDIESGLIMQHFPWTPWRFLIPSSHWSFYLAEQLWLSSVQVVV